jgi:DNA polymerase III epsilon subunit family exonuclease
MSASRPPGPRRDVVKYWSAPGILITPAPIPAGGFVQQHRLAREERAELCDRALDYFCEVDRPVPSNELVRVLFPRARVDAGHSPRIVRDILRRDRRFQEPRVGTWDLIGARCHHQPLHDARFCVVDLEATGSNPDRDQVIEVGIVVVENLEVADRYSTLVNPGQQIPVWIRRLTGIDDETVADAPEFADVAPEIVDLLRGGVFVAHNVDFDSRFLRARLAVEEVPTPWWPTLCTVRLSRRFLVDEESYRLDVLADRLGIQLDQHHRAVYDAEAAAYILLHILEDYAPAKGIETVGELLASAQGAALDRVG